MNKTFTPLPSKVTDSAEREPISTSRNALAHGNEFSRKAWRKIRRRKRHLSSLHRQFIPVLPFWFCSDNGAGSSFFIRIRSARTDTALKSVPGTIFLILVFFLMKVGPAPVFEDALANNLEANMIDWVSYSRFGRKGREFNPIKLVLFGRQTCTYMCVCVLVYAVGFCCLRENPSKMMDDFPLLWHINPISLKTFWLVRNFMWVVSGGKCGPNYVIMCVCTNSNIRRWVTWTNHSVVVLSDELKRIKNWLFTIFASFYNCILCL